MAERLLIEEFIVTRLVADKFWEVVIKLDNFFLLLSSHF